MDPDAALRALGGIATLRQLAGSGCAPAVVRYRARTGRIRRVREGVFATLDCPVEVIAAAEVGGRLAGASAARHLGFWSPPDDRLVVEVPRGVHTAPRPKTTVVRAPVGPPAFGCAQPTDVIAQVLRSEPTPIAVAILDSMLRGGVDEVDVHLAASTVAARFRRATSLLDCRAESGTESVVRAALALVDIRAEPQRRVPLTDLDRLDLLIGDRLVIECDSRGFHSAPGELDRDNDRDLMLIRLGYLVIRVRYRAAMHDLSGVVDAIRRYVDEGLHLDATAPSRRTRPFPAP